MLRGIIAKPSGKSSLVAAAAPELPSRSPANRSRRQEVMKEAEKTGIEGTNSMVMSVVRVAARYASASALPACLQQAAT
jgi:hypothetical protein